MRYLALYDVEEGREDARVRRAIRRFVESGEAEVHSINGILLHHLCNHCVEALRREATRADRSRTEFGRHEGEEPEFPSDPLHDVAPLDREPLELERVEAARSAAQGRRQRPRAGGYPVAARNARAVASGLGYLVLDQVKTVMQTVSDTSKTVTEIQQAQAVEREANRARDARLDGHAADDLRRDGRLDELDRRVTRVELRSGGSVQ